MTGHDHLPAPPESDFLFYRTEDGQTQIRVLLAEKTVWMPQKLIAELYGTTPQNITQHIKSIYEEGELDATATCKRYLQVRIEGNREVKRDVDHYNLDMILAIGYRVRSPRGVQFRQWATRTLREYLIKGFVLDDERLKRCETTFGEDYFEELLERIRDIRSSERRFYQKITDIYATSIDYDGHADITQQFYATVQNKLHWAIHGHTAAELVQERADADKPHMGLSTWKNAPDGPVRKADVSVAKNYLNESELSELNRIVTMYLDYAEDQARRRQTMTMSRWIERLDAFLQFNDREILRDAGRVSHAVAEQLAHDEYEKYRARRIQQEDAGQLSDFDRFSRRMLEDGGKGDEQ